MKIKTFTRQINWLGFTEHGAANGYAIIPVGHPCHGVKYDDIPVDVHGGLIFSEKLETIMDWVEILDMVTDDDFDPGAWVVGFDTAHFGDNFFTWSLENVERETKNLGAQLELLE